MSCGTAWLTNKNLTLEDIDELVYNGALPAVPGSKASPSNPKARKWPKNRSSEIISEDGISPIDGQEQV